MISFNKIILHNFGSYADAILELDSKGFCLVTGKNNYKKDNALSNGSGKSLIWSAICFTITGETISGLRTNLKNINAEDSSAYTTLHFVVDSDTYEVTRTIAPKSDVQIIKNGVDISGKTYRESEKKLTEQLPTLTRDLIGSCMIIGQGMPNKFSAYSPSGRKELLEKLTKCDFMIEDAKNRIAQLQTALNTELRNYDDSLLVNKTNVYSQEQSLTKIETELTTRVKPDFVSELKACEASLLSLSQSIVAHNKAKTELEEKLAAVETDLLTVSDKKAADMQTLITNYTTANQQLSVSIQTTTIELTNYTTELTKQKSIKDVCPTCGQKLINVVLPDTSELEQSITGKKKLLGELNAQQLANRQKYNDYVNQISSMYDLTIQQYKTEIATLKSKIKTESDAVMTDTVEQMTITNQQSKLLADQSSWDRHTIELNNEKNKCETELARLNAQVNKLEADREIVVEKLAYLKKIDTLTKRNFRGYLLENIINYLDNKAKDYCKIVFGTTDLSIYLDGNALDISYGGKMFDNLSGGEKQRVDLILQFAIRNLLSTYLDFAANMLVLDEITDFLDKQSCAAVMKLIENELNTISSVFIVSHHADELGLPIDTQIQIEKTTEGISKIL